MARIQKAASSDGSSSSSQAASLRKGHRHGGVGNSGAGGLRMRSASDANKPDLVVPALDSCFSLNKENDGLPLVISAIQNVTTAVAPIIKTGSSLKAPLEKHNNSVKATTEEAGVQVSTFPMDLSAAGASGISNSTSATPSNQDAVVKWLTEPKVEDGNYWRALAEQRRVALEETLKENEELSDELELAKAENEHLKGLADKAAKLEELLLGLGYALEL